MDELSVEDGVHVYVLAPEEIICDDCPMQIVSFGETETTGDGFTVTVVCIDAVQPFALPVTV